MDKHTTPPGSRSPGTSKEDWIASQLRHVYDETLKEAIPADLIALLDQLDEAESVERPVEGKEPK